MDSQLLKRKAQLLTGRPLEVEVEIKKRNFLQKLFNRPTYKVFLVNTTRLSTLIFFSELVQGLTNPKDSLNKGLANLIATISNDGPLIFRIIALLIEDTDREPSSGLIRFLRKNLEVQDTKLLLVKLLQHSQVEDFLSTTILIRKMSLLKTEELIAFEKETEKTFGNISAA